MSKNEFRTFFANVKPFCKMNYFLKLSNVNPVCFTRFMKGEEWNYTISLEKLQCLYNNICDILQKIA